MRNSAGLPQHPVHLPKTESFIRLRTGDKITDGSSGKPPTEVDAEKFADRYKTAIENSATYANQPPRPPVFKADAKDKE